jgi:hypothetical protein
MTDVAGRLRSLFFAFAWAACFAVLAAEPASDVGASNATSAVTATSARERLSGRFLVAWIGDRDDDDALAVHFVPDVLPEHWLGADCDLGSLAIVNRDEVFLGLLGPELAALVAEGEFAGVEGEATLVLDSVEREVVCRGEVGAARIILIERVRVLRAWTPAQRAQDRYYE